MKIIIFDPKLSRFGHHISFNEQVLRITANADNHVIFLDVDDIMSKEADLNGANCIPVTSNGLEDSSSTPLKGIELTVRLKQPEWCKRLWESISHLTPDVVIITSEGTSRLPLIEAIPLNSHFKVFVVVHVIWSVLNNLRSDSRLLTAYQTRLAGVFVVEPFLVDELMDLGLPVMHFPHRSYSKESIKQKIIQRSSDISKIPLVGTIGVINERRNHKFLYEALSMIDTPIRYVVAGELMPIVEEEVRAAENHFRASSNLELETRYEYLPDNELNQLLNRIDIGVIAYDKERTLQGSGAIYTYAEAGVPLLVPDIELFRQYLISFPGVLFKYSANDGSALRNVLKNMIKDLRCYDSWMRYQRAREHFLLANSVDRHRVIVNALLTSAIKTKVPGPSLLSQGNRAMEQRQLRDAESFYLGSIALGPKHHSAFLNHMSLLKRLGDFKRFTCAKTRAVMRFANIREAHGFMLERGKPLEVLIYPPIINQSELNDLLARIVWHLWPIREFVFKVHIFSPHLIPTPIALSPFIASNISEMALEFLDKFVNNSKNITSCNLDAIDFSIVWKYTNEKERRYPFPEQCKSLYHKPIWRVDETTERFATSHMLKAVSSLVDTSSSQERGSRIFNELSAKFDKRTIAVFGTGPSLSRAFEESFEDKDTIAANSMVKNIRLLDHLQPKLIVCADPIFHAGPSTYAEEFRQQLRTALLRYKCPLMVPERDVHIYSSYFESDDVDIIAVPFVKSDLPNYQMQIDFNVTTTGNILTLFLLQVAFTLSERVEIYGCDGRPKKDNNYFWGHDKSAQFNDKMDDIKHAHPGFFNINYDDYYDEHCATLEKWLSHAESIGKKAVSRTFSYIHALRKREYQLIS